ncbi:hypothetical protein PF008_g12615 [Phytophthora fragariae]|uniref:Uncharacterized protein n=1 Tax=Phytophthora fragariae TaxID=53985 RepID=A0A6G0RMV8_9STRA|nr:hypothetical protein PF008_g12615 [Phytophthora fragariae]
MSLNDLTPDNTKHAHESAVLSFMKLLEEVGVRWDYLEVCMQRENTPLVLEAVVDKVGMYPTFKEVHKEHPPLCHAVLPADEELAAGTVPQRRVATDKTLLMKGEVLERYCMKRESGAFVNKTPACTKKALKKMMMHVYSTAVTTAD